MDQVRKMKQHKEIRRPVSCNSDTGECSNGTRLVPFKWESHAGNAKRQFENYDDESDAHEPKVVQLNLKASLMGVHILDDDEELFFSRQSSMSSMISENCRPGVAVPFKWEAEPGRPIDLPKIELPVARLMPPPGSRVHSGLLQYSQPSTPHGSHTHPMSGALYPGGSSKVPSGMLYPCPNPGSRQNSSLLNAVHFTFGGNPLGLEAETSGANNLTERIFKKLVGQSRLQICSSKGGESSGNNLEIESEFGVPDDDSDSPVSTLDLPRSGPASPNSSERSFRGKSKRKSLRRRSDDANSTTGSSQLVPIDPNAPRPKSQLAQYLLSIAAVTADVTDDDDILTLEGPSEVAWHEPEEQQYHPEFPVVEGYTSTHRNLSKPTHERWTSNSSSWNLSLVQNPLKTVSTIVSRSKHLHATVPGRSLRRASRRDKDSKMSMSLTTSYDGGPRAIKRGVLSEVSSGRSWWRDLGSGRNHASGSGRLQIEVADEPDIDEPDLEQASNVNRLQKDNRRKMNENDFPFNSPIASSFVFGETDKSRMADSQEPVPVPRMMLPKSVASLAETESSDLHFSDNYHDPETGSITDSDDSLTYSLEKEANGVLDQPPQWVPTRSFNYVKEVVDGIGSSSRGMSGFMEIGRSGRFSIDLQRGQKLDKAEHLRSPSASLRKVKAEKPARRSLLSPCLPFLHRSHKTVPRIQQAQVAAPAPRLHPVNSFTARLGPKAAAPATLDQFQFS